MMTPSQDAIRLAKTLTTDPAYKELLEQMRLAGFSLFEATLPTEPDKLVEARLLLTSISVLDGMLTSWAAVGKQSEGID